MLQGFQKILIPVDFSAGTDIAVRKVHGLKKTGLLGDEAPQIHLLHVVKSPPAWAAWLGNSLLSGKQRSAEHKFRLRDPLQQLDHWKISLECSLPGSRISTSLLEGPSIADLIIAGARLWEPDLIIIGRQGKEPGRWTGSTIYPDRIARQTNIPVLTLKKGALDRKTRIIVLPIRDFVPEHKLELAILLARKLRAQVHLITFPGNSTSNGGSTGQAFIQSFHRLRNELGHPVEHFASTLSDPARATLDYAESVMADLVLVSPGRESGISSFRRSRHISEFLHKDSGIQVLDVGPP